MSVPLLLQQDPDKALIKHPDIFIKNCHITRKLFITVIQMYFI